MAPDGTSFSWHGCPDGPPVVLIHGLGLTREVWQWTRPALANRYRLLSYDLYGHGDSSPPPGAPSLGLFSRQLLGLLDHAGLDRVAIVGFSLGGMIARKVAQDAPARVSALAVLHSPHRRTPEAQAAILARVEQARQSGPASTVKAALERWFSDGFRADNPEVMNVVRGWVTGNDPAMYPSIYRVLAEGTDEIVAPSPPIAAPALVITGDEDHGNGPEMTRAIAGEIKGAEAVILPGLRHMALVEDPPAVNGPLRAFLDRVFDADQRRALRDAFGSFATGVTVVTTREPDGTPRGFTANSFASVSLDPPLLLICIAKTAHSCAIFEGCSAFAINVLGEGQKAVSGLFASREPDKFERCDWHSGGLGAPILDGTLAAFECTPERLVDAGDHLVLIGRIAHHETRDGAPLGYYRGSYFTLGLDRSLVEAASRPGRLIIGAVVEQENRILLETCADGSVRVPRAPADASSVEALCAMFEAAGLMVTLDFLYAVYEDREAGTHGIFYHGRAEGLAPGGMAFHALDGLPLDRIASSAERSMLERYAQEFRHGAFGIYQGNEIEGTIRHIAGAKPE